VGYIPDDLTAEVFRPFNVTKGCSLAGRNAPAELILDYYLSQAVEKTERKQAEGALQRGETEDAAASTRAGDVSASRTARLGVIIDGHTNGMGRDKFLDRIIKSQDEKGSPKNFHVRCPLTS